MGGGSSQGSIYGALYDGHVVAAHVRKGITTVDPTEEGSNAAAIDAANASITDEPTKAGTIYLPAYDPNGEPFSIERQVIVGSRQANAAVSVRAPTTADAVRETDDGLAITGAITTEIDDGDAVFVMASNSETGGRSARGVVFDGQYSLGDNDASLLRMENVNNFHVAPTARHYTGSAVIIDGVANGTFGGTYLPYNEDALIFDSRSGYQKDDSDITFLPNIEAETAYQEFLTDKNGGKLTKARVGGHLEGALGEAHVYITNKSSVIITDYARFGHTGKWNGPEPANDNRTHGLKYTGSGWLAIQGGTFAKLTGDSIRIEGDHLTWLRIDPAVDTNPLNVQGQDLVMEAPPQEHGVIPDAASWANGASLPSDTDTLRAVQTSSI
jgi:hypothetical protein